MEGKSAFSSEDDVTKKTIDAVSKPSTDADKLAEVYELDRCLDWIQKNGFTKVALQFPDERLADAVPVHSHLQRAVSPSTTVFILGDTSYGSCCVDEVAAEHYGADSVVHYGPSCLSPCQAMLALLVLCPQPVDIPHAAHHLLPLCSPPPCPTLLVMADTMYQHAVEPLTEQLKAAGIDAIASHLQLPPSSPPSASSSSSSNATKEEAEKDTAHNQHHSSTPANTEHSDFDDVRKDSASEKEEGGGDIKKENGFCWHCRCHRRFALPAGSKIEDLTVCFIGEEGKVLTNLMMTLNKNPFLSYSPETRTARRETLNVNRELMRRYYLMERAKEAKIVGVVAGTLGVSRTREIIHQLKTLVKAAGKKSYSFVVGKLNVPKLANFLEVDVFVLVSCPLNSLIDSKEFLRPVVTPFEMEIACNQARTWTGDYVTDFLQLLPGAADHVPAVTPEEDTADVSLISNKMVALGQRSAQVGQGESSALIPRSDAMALTSLSADTAGEFLSSRSWQGLERQLGQTPVEKAKEGRSGIALGYQNEPQ